MYERVAMFQLVVCSIVANPACLNGKAAVMAMYIPSFIVQSVRSRAKVIITHTPSTLGACEVHARHRKESYC